MPAPIGRSPHPEPALGAPVPLAVRRPPGPWTWVAWPRPLPCPLPGPDARRADRTRGAGPGTSGRRWHPWGRGPGCTQDGAERGGAWGGRGGAGWAGGAAQASWGVRARGLDAAPPSGGWASRPALCLGPKPLELGGYLGPSFGGGALVLGAQPLYFSAESPPFLAALTRVDLGRIALPRLPRVPA